MEITAVPTEQQTEIPNLPAESFMTSNVIVAPAAVKGVAAGVSPATQDSLPVRPVLFPRLKTKKRSGKAGTRRKISWDEPSAAGSFYSRGWHSRLATWSFGYTGLAWLTYGTGAAILAYGLTLAFKFFRVRRNHYYRLTTHRLFLTTGLFHRRVDQVELVRIKDLFVQQNLISVVA